jgi:transcriptional regulator with XRE-family HTH domain
MSAGGNAVPRPHPIKSELAARRITIRELSRNTGVNPGTAGRILNGYMEPWPAFRQRCAEQLGLPESELFRDPVGVE